MSTDTPKLVMLRGFIHRSFKYISKNTLRFIFLLIKRFSGGVVGEPGFPTILLVIIDYIVMLIFISNYYFLYLKHELPYEYKYS